jgi:WD40 repeat protein
MVGGDNKMVYTYDINTHEMIDVWSIGSTITSITCLSLEDGGFIIAVGTNDGKVAI